MDYEPHSQGISCFHQLFVTVTTFSCYQDRLSTLTLDLDGEFDNDCSDQLEKKETQALNSQLTDLNCQKCY